MRLHRQMVLAIAVVAIFAIVVAGAYADDYYVATTGSDTTGDGSSGNPWQTVAHALSWISTNDPGSVVDPHTIYIAAGTYDSSIGESYPLTMQSYVSLSGDDEATTILDAENNEYHVIYCYSANNFTIENLTITRGNANGPSEDARGGGIYCRGSSPTLTNCTVSANFARFGGGIYYGYSSSPTLTNCTVSANSADYFGGGIYSYVGSLTLTGCAVSGNTADLHGGGIYCYDSSPTITDCTLSGNTASDFGGGISCGSSSNPELMNCLLVDNSANYGGGVHCEEDNGNPPTLTNCTIADNSASESDGGGGIYCVSGSTVTVKNGILWGDTANGASDEISGYGTVTVTYSDVEGGWTGTGNIDEDPLFVGSYYLSHVAAGQDNDSPCIDRGDDTAANLGLDDRTTRVDGGYDTGQVDMGYHYDEGSGLHHYVDKTHGDDSNGGTSWEDAFATIQKGINSCNTGSSGDPDMVHVAAQTYYENIVLDSYITLWGGYPAGGGALDPDLNVTIIDGDADGTVVRINGKDEVTVDGFTIQNGKTTGGGGGIRCINSSARLADCTISDNISAASGGGIYCYDSSPTLTDCTISGNSTSYHGAGIYYYGGSPALRGCTVSDNTADQDGGGIYCIDSSPTLTNGLISSNTADFGGGIYCYESSPTVTNCTLADNQAYSYGGGIYCYDSGSHPDIENCILWGDTAGGVSNEISGSGTVTVTYSDVEGGWAGTGNIDEDPLFVGSYYLSHIAAGQSSDSPCIDVGSDTAANLNLDDRTTRVDGVYDTGQVDMGYHYDEGSELHHYVDAASGDDNDSGDSWDDAFATIQKAIDVCEEGTCDDPDVIHVAEGTYVENLVLDSNITMLGGYPAGGGARDPDTYETIIDGNAVDSVVTIDAKECLTIDGFTITNGSATNGGGIYCYDSSPTLIDLTISNNDAYDGAGMYCSNSSPTLTDCTLSDNEASHDGGGIYYYYYSSGTLTGCRFSGNEAGRGGGIYAYHHSSPDLTGCGLSDNHADTYGGGICGHYYSSGTLTNCTISGNTAYYDGGGAYYFDNCSPTLTDCTLSDNRVSSDGGGILCRYRSDPELTNCLIVSNSANYGGGFHCEEYSGYPSSPTLTNCTIADNEASETDGGGGIYCQAGNTVTVKNSILWGDTAGGVSNEISGDGTVTVTYSDVEGGWTGTGNIDEDPMFVPHDEYGRHTAYYLAHEGAQAVYSPCVDAGSGSVSDYGLEGTTTCTDGREDGDDDGNGDTGPIDMGYHYPEGYDGEDDTYIELASFEARADGSSVVLTWETGAEIRNAGFVLFRTIAGVKDYRQISDLIGARGTPASGASYSFTDSNVEPGVMYEYWLVDIETSGKWTAHGPASAGLPMSLNLIQLPSAFAQGYGGQATNAR